MSHTGDDTIAPGRPVRLVPTAPGFWMTLLGACLAAVAPLFGFLLGSMRGRPDANLAMDPIYLGLFGGVLVGAVGVLLAVLGGVRLWRNAHRADGSEGMKQ